MMKHLIITVFAYLLLLTACKDPFLDTPFIEKSNENINLSNAEYLQKNFENNSLWIELLKYADLYNGLNDASTYSTIFVPTNGAVKEFLIWRGVDNVRELSKEYARYVAQVHIMKGIMRETELISYVEKGSIPIKTLFGTYLTTSYGFKNEDIDDEYLNSVVVEDPNAIYLNNQAKVSNLGRAEITANGIVYSLEHVIRPLSEPILEKLRTYGGYDIFINTVEKTGYDKIVSQYADTVLNLDGSISVSDIRFTCFAVPDLVYKNLGINSANELASFLNASTDYENPQNALYQYVMYHFLGQTYSRAVLSKFRAIGDVKIIDTKLPGNVITVQLQDGKLMINEAATIIRSNIKARNGLIHKIDNILPVYEPKPIKVTWDFCNSPDIESFINSYGAAKSLGDLFTSELSNKEYQIDLSEDKLEGNYGTIKAFEYMANESKTPTRSWRKVGFFKCSYVSIAEKNVNKYGAYMDNLFILNLGYAGNITLKTPTIIKGKYKIVMYYAGAPGLRTFYTNGSNTKFRLDDYQKTIYMWKGIPATFVDVEKQSNINANGIASEVLWDNVVFDSSASHTFKAIIMDINAKTNSSYRQMWDYLEFIPID